MAFTMVKGMRMIIVQLAQSDMSYSRVLQCVPLQSRPLKRACVLTEKSGFSVVLPISVPQASQWFSSFSSNTLIQLLSLLV